MKRKIALIITTICILWGCTSIVTQTYDFKHFSLDLPEGEWEVNEENIPGVNGNLVMLGKSENDAATNTVMILSFGQIMDPEYMIRNNASLGRFFKSEDIEIVNDYTFKGIKAKTVSGKTTQGGAIYFSNCYAFIYDDISYLIIDITENGHQIDYDKAIWSRLKFKDIDKKLVASVDDEILEIIEGVKPYLKGGQIEEGLLARDVNFDNINKVLEYDYDFTETDIDADDRKDFEDIMREILILELKAMKNNIELVSKCMEVGYSFRYRYFYQDKVVADILITAKEYNQ